ncbi:hypothetical protein HWV62_25790 [Athelia sp. TMB]|nr:hypothetical protein HWV62_25790 [Athelia sp. TMB]
MTAQNEQESLDLLVSLMGDGDPEVAKRVYKKFNGDMQRAASAILEGDTGAEAGSGTAQRPGTPVAGLSPLANSIEFLPQAAPGLKGPSPVIDLTGDEDTEMARALEASLQTPSNPQLGPAPKSTNDWQVAIRPNAESGPAVSQDDQQMSRAIQESLQGSFDQAAEDQLETLPLSANFRKDKRPMALRPSKPSYAYAALIVQALFFVPQVRLAVSRYRPSSEQLESIPDPEEDFMWTLLDLFTMMDLALTAQLVPDDLISKFEISGWTRPTDLPCKLSNDFYDKFSEIVEQIISRMLIITDPSSRQKGRMFHFSYGNGTGDDTIGDLPDVTSIVSVTVGSNSNEGSQDLMSCLSAQFAPPGNEAQRKQNVILELSDIVAFELHPGYRGSAKDRKPFSFPKVIYLDQFMQENADFAQAARARQRAISEEVDKLTLRKKSLTSFDNKNTLKDLRSTVYYYEQVADANGDATRQADIERTCNKLKHILASIENEVKTIDAKIIELNAESQTLFDVPEMQANGYNLRAVFIHDGLFGRRSLYSYVQDQDKWWKTHDASVTEVTEETVLSDSTGLHLGAGPYMLIYSQNMPEELHDEVLKPNWPQKLTVGHEDETTRENLAYLAQRKQLGLDVDSCLAPSVSLMEVDTSADSEEEDPEALLVASAAPGIMHY